MDTVTGLVVLFVGYGGYRLVRWMRETDRDLKSRAAHKDARQQALALMTPEERRCFLDEERQQENRDGGGFETPYHWPKMSKSERYLYRQQQGWREAETEEMLDHERD